MKKVFLVTFKFTFINGKKKKAMFSFLSKKNSLSFIENAKIMVTEREKNIQYIKKIIISGHETFIIDDKKGNEKILKQLKEVLNG